ncbi:MAG: hypothetical protein QW478_11840 [Candidatus Micrarchaeaceae archaeon]
MENVRIILDVYKIQYKYINREITAAFILQFKKSIGFSRFLDNCVQ